MSFQRTTAPSETLFDIAKVKSFLRVTHVDPDNDARIADIATAVEAILDGPDGMVGRALINQSYEYATHLPRPGQREIRVPLVPAKALESVVYTDAAGEEQGIPAEQFDLIATAHQTFVRLREGYGWPAARVQPFALRIRCQFGYGGRSEVPQNIIAAGHMLIWHYYENRMAVFAREMHEVPLGVAALLDPLRVRFAG